MVDRLAKRLLSLVTLAATVTPTHTIHTHQLYTHTTTSNCLSSVCGLTWVITDDLPDLLTL